jgi:hypothetical protein
MRCGTILIYSFPSNSTTSAPQSTLVPPSIHLLIVSSTKVEVIENGTIIVDHEGNIAAVGTEAELSEAFRSATFATDIDATGKVVLPGTPPPNHTTLSLLCPLPSDTRRRRTR